MEHSLRSFESGLDLWLSAHSLGRRDRSKAFNREIASTIRRHWPNPGQVIPKITHDDVLRFAEKVAHYAPSRWNAIVSALKFIIPGDLPIKRRRIRLREFNPPTQAEFSRLLAECDKAPRSQVGLIVRFLALTGLRISEARGLRWENILHDRIEVPGRITKNGRQRCIPKIDGLDEVLRRLRSLAGEYVLPRMSCRRAIATACRRAGLPRMSHHDFRHLFATRCIESGVDPQTLARWMGHADGGSLLSKVYFHLLDDHSRRMAAKVRIAA